LLDLRDWCLEGNIWWIRVLQRAHTPNIEDGNLRKWELEFLGFFIVALTNMIFG